MKLKSSFFILLAGACLLVSLPTSAQNQNPPQNTVQMQEDANRLREAEQLKDKNKAIAKETGRVNRDATMAARDAKRAAKAERKAQNIRIDADKKSRKAAVSNEKSRINNR